MDIYIEEIATNMEEIATDVPESAGNIGEIVIKTCSSAVG